MQPIDYTALQLPSKNDRQSPLATAVYATTCAVFLLFIATFGIHPLPLILLAFLFLGTLLCLAGSYIMLRRRSTSPPRIDDLWPFAEVNNLHIVSAQPPSNLSSQVRIRLLIRGIVKSYIPWYFDILLSLHGTYKKYPISFYSLRMAIGTPSNSTIEEEAETLSYAQPSSLATLTLTMSDGGRASIRPGCGVVLWEIPEISLQDTKKLRKKLWRYNTAINVQSDGKKIAILLDTNIPYDRKGMEKLFQLLDHVDTLLPQLHLSK